MNDLIQIIAGLADDGTLQKWLIAIAIVAVTALVARLMTKLIRRIMSTDGIPLPSVSIVVNVARIVIWTLGLSIMLSACFAVDVNGLIAALGIGGLAISLGLQDTIKNFIGGLQVTIMKIIRPGDHIIVGATEGIVQDVSWRQTVVKDYENNVHLIPNAVINTSEVTRISPEFLVATVVVLNNDGRDIDAMLREMEALAKRAVEKVATLEKDPWLLVTQIGEYGVWAKMRFVLAEVDHAREARDAALRAIAPYTRNSASEVLLDDGADD